MLHIFARSIRHRISLLPATLLLTGISLTSTGCANFTSAAPTASSASSGFGGSVFGGRQPISGATVQVYAAGATGYGSAASLLASTTTNAAGAFSFPAGTYACPATGSGAASSQTLYLTSTGGQPTTGVTNANAVLLAVLGDCNTVISTQPNVLMNEVTTIAGMFALQQFFNVSTESFGTSAGNAQGLINAAATVNNLVTLNSGSAVTSKTVTGALTGYSTPPSVTITPEATKLNTLADILAACINSDGSTTSSGSLCSTLFSNVNAPAAADTLQAAYYLATNPTSTVSGSSRMATLYNTISAQSPYPAVLTSAPTDWTLGITYGSSSSQTVSGAQTYLLTNPQFVAIDVAGNIWIANSQTTVTNGVGNSVTELSPVGTPINQALTAAGQVAGPQALILDAANNVFVSNYGGVGALGSSVSEYTLGGEARQFVTGAGPAALAADGMGNLFLSTVSSGVGAADLEAIPANSATGTVASVIATGASATALSGLAVDGNETIYLTNGTSGTVQYLCSQTAFTCYGNFTNAGGQGMAQPVAIDANNDVFVANSSTTAGSLSEILAQVNTGSNIFMGMGPYQGGGLLSAQRLLIDGAGNLWGTSSGSSAGTLSELTPGGVALSPSGGFAHNFSGASGLAIDGSGNLWVGNASSAASGTAQGYVNEIVGAAAPVVTPLAAALPGMPGTSTRLGQRP